MNGEVIILTGPPAAGKTTVAGLLATDASSPTVHLTTDLFYRSIRTGFVLPFLPAAQRQNEVVIDAIVGTVTTFARGGYDVVVDGIIGPWFLPPFRAAAANGGLTHPRVQRSGRVSSTFANGCCRPRRARVAY